MIVYSFFILQLLKNEVFVKQVQKIWCKIAPLQIHTNKTILDDQLTNIKNFRTF
jgi:hypothetical protein